MIIKKKKHTQTKADFYNFTSKSHKSQHMNILQRKKKNNGIILYSIVGQYIIITWDMYFTKVLITWDFLSFFHGTNTTTTTDTHTAST